MRPHIGGEKSHDSCGPEVVQKSVSCGVPVRCSEQVSNEAYVHSVLCVLKGGNKIDWDGKTCFIH